MDGVRTDSKDSPGSEHPFRIFLSSTATDLAQHRASVIAAIGRLRHQAVHMAAFGASPRAPLPECQRLAAEADALVVCVAYRYGWVPSVREGGDGETSVTWYEVKAALKANRPVFAFLVDPQVPWTEAKEQDRLTEARTEKEGEAIRRAVERLEAFRGFLRAEVMVDFFSTPDDLVAKVVTSLFPWLLGELTPRCPVEQSSSLTRSELTDQEPKQHATKIRRATARRGRPVPGHSVICLEISTPAATSEVMKVITSAGVNVVDWKTRPSGLVTLAIDSLDCFEALRQRLMALTDVRSVMVEPFKENMRSEQNRESS